MSTFLRIEDLQVYQKLCQLHIKVCRVTKAWPRDERFELTGQVRRSSNSAPAQLAEKHSDRYVRNKIEGVNGSRGEANEIIHHLYVAKLKGCMSDAEYVSLKGEYKTCIRMLNGLERKLEKQLPEKDRRWPP